MRAIPVLLAIALLVAVTVFIADRPGDVSVLWQGWRIETSVAVLALGTAALALVVASAFAILRRLAGGPRAFLRGRRERRRRAGYRALTQGMVAVAAGDPEEAQRFARKADVLLAEPPLTLLLSAQAAQLNGDEDAARKYFTAMLNRPETEFLGLRGLIMQARKTGEHATALRLAERARQLRPRTPWVLASLFDLQTRRGLWREAQATLVDCGKRKALPADDLRRHAAALHYERSLEAEADGRPRDALAAAEKAVSLAPGFSAAVQRAAELLARDGRQRQAAKTIEAGWRHLPHPHLAASYGALADGAAPLQRVKQIERLASFNPGHPESHIAIAAAALEAQLWGEARRHLEAIGGKTNGTRPPARVCRLMAALEEAEHGDGAAARTWLERAAEAPPDPLYQCSACAAESLRWHALCPNCGTFDTLLWKVPARAAMPALPGVVAAPVQRLAAPAAETPETAAGKAA